jgi:3-oxosteroid 1-dehydrogenase
MSEIKKSVSRRDFLKGAAVGAGAVGLAGLGGITEATAAAQPLPRKWDHEADVVIIGLGGAGACAAIEAFEHKAKVLILEKQPKETHVSNSRMCGGVFHNPDPTGDRAALVQYLEAMMSGGNIPWMLEGEQPDKMPGMAEAFAELEVQNVDWMMSIDPELDRTSLTPIGVTAFKTFPGFEKSKYRLYGTFRYPKAGEAPKDLNAFNKPALPKLQKSMGEAWMHALIEVGIKNRSKGIQILYGTPAKDLIMDKGEVVGVYAMRAGKQIACKARKAVILTAGGYEYNKAMRRAFLEGPGVKGWTFYGSPDNRGEGIEMAIKIGAGLAKVGKAASRIEPGVPFGRGYDETGLKMGMYSTASSKNSIVVDNYGKRYCNEHDITNSAAPFRYQFYKMAVWYDMYKMNFPRLPSWHILDEKLRKAGPVASGGPVSFGMIPWDEENNEAIRRGWLLKADTIAELAAKIKSDPENRSLLDVDALAKTISDYNSYCAAGKDPEFGRTPATMGAVDQPPFYALKLYAGGPNTKGGIDANAKREVLDWKGKPIPRLYSAGEISSVFKFTYQAGGNVTECIVCGRIAGKNAASLPSRK